MAGKTWDRSKTGPRPPLPSDVVDPANGCMNGCGEIRVSLLYDFQLYRNGKHAGHWRLCGECYRWGQGGHPPLDPDPRHVPEKAA